MQIEIYMPNRSMDIPQGRLLQLCRMVPCLECSRPGRQFWYPLRRRQWHPFSTPEYQPAFDECPRCGHWPPVLAVIQAWDIVCGVKR